MSKKERQDFRQHKVWLNQAEAKKLDEIAAIYTKGKFAAAFRLLLANVQPGPIVNLPEPPTE